jgi:glycosyltransferase involved in cell wall biosynthesis
MRVGVDATCWQNTRGYGRHARALLSTLVRLDAHNRYTFFMDSAQGSETVPPEAEVRFVRASAPTALAASSNGHRSLRDMWSMSRAMSDATFEVLFFPTIYSYVPVFSRAKKVVMIHDVIADTYPQYTLPSRRSRLLWKAKVLLGYRQAHAIVTVSDYSRHGILNLFKISPERIFVVGEASDSIFRALDLPLPTPHLESLGITSNGRLVVYVGGFSPHKNLEVLVASFARLAAHETFSDVRLVMVGEYRREVFHSYFGIIKNQVEKLRIADRVLFTGYLADEELVTLLNLATVLVLPSLMEGFGLPAVEAAACGCPVIATKASPLPNLLGCGALYIDPAKDEDLDLALTRVLQSENLRLRMREAALAAARRLTWDSAARQFISVMREVMRQ